MEVDVLLSSDAFLLDELDICPAPLEPLGAFVRPIQTPSLNTDEPLALHLLTNLDNGDNVHHDAAAAAAGTTITSPATPP